MVRDRYSCYFWFWTIFCLYTPRTPPKMKILIRWKNHLEISLVYTSVPRLMIIRYTIPEIWCVTDIIFIFHFVLFFALLPRNRPKAKHFKKMKKKVWIYYHFAHEYHQSKSRCMISEIRSATDNFFSYFGPFFCSFTLPSQLHLNNPRNQIEKTTLRKTPSDIMRECS